MDLINEIEIQVMLKIIILPKYTLKIEIDKKPL